MPRYQIIDFPLHRDERGDLIPFELDETFPFTVKRVYLVTSRDKAVRGGHAHIVESELFVAIHGGIKAKVNDGSGDTIVELNSKNKGLLVQPHCWHEFHDFSEDAVLLCFSSTRYLPGESNYITDESLFLEGSKLADNKFEVPSGWKQGVNSLEKNFSFKDFSDAIAFINQIHQTAEKHGHHPDLELHNYAQLRVTLSTHDEGRFTVKDIKLAESINELAD